VRRYLVRRLASFGVTLLFVSALAFIAVRVLPGDPALLIMGPEGNPEATARLRAALGLDRPIPVQYVEWLGRALRGDLGVSIQYDVPVGRLIASRLPVTLPLTALAGLFMVAVALPLGLYAATRHRRAGDYATMIISQLGIAVPSFWTGLLLILLFSVHLGWVRSGGFEGWSAGLGPALRSLLLPALALGAFQAAVLVRATRSAVLDVLREDYVRTARAKGVGEARVIGAHTLRNALIPILTVAGVQLGQLMAGSIILESVFALPGLGRLALGAIAARDLPLVQGVALFVASSIVIINFAVDIAYALADPRIRHDGGR
jgi:peptide/nickel transport system permease protein